jgi:hypothetical protein
MIRDGIDLPEKVELKPKPNCKYCFGRGYIRIIRPDLDANKFREIRPCSCVKAIVKAEQLNPENIAEQKIIR